MKIMTTYNVFIIAIGFCLSVAITNVITNVVKKLIKPAQVVCLITSIVISELGTYLYCTYFSVVLYWYIYIIAIIIGFLISYTAMYGYDNLYKQIKEVITRSKEINNIVGDKNE